MNSGVSKQAFFALSPNRSVHASFIRHFAKAQSGNVPSRRILSTKMLMSCWPSVGCAKSCRHLTLHELNTRAQRMFTVTSRAPRHGGILKHLANFLERSMQLASIAVVARGVSAALTNYAFHGCASRYTSLIDSHISLARSSSAFCFSCEGWAAGIGTPFPVAVFLNLSIGPRA